MRAPSWWRRRRVEPTVVAVYEQPLGLVDLHHVDVERRRAAERAWLRTAREHQAAAHARRLADG